MKKKVLIIGGVIICCMFILLLVGYEKVDRNSVKINYGTSTIYTEEDMKQAIAKIIEEFNDFKGCKLYSLSYISDDKCNNEDNIKWMNDLESANDNKEVFTQCIAFESSFRSPINVGGAWNANSKYNWSWWLARSENGDWKLMTWGY